MTRSAGSSGASSGDPVETGAGEGQEDEVPPVDDILSSNAIQMATKQ